MRKKKSGKVESGINGKDTTDEEEEAEKTDITLDVISRLTMMTCSFSFLSPL